MTAKNYSADCAHFRNRRLAETSAGMFRVFVASELDSPKSVTRSYNAARHARGIDLSRRIPKFGGKIL